jgi:hypothetical protein
MQPTKVPFWGIIWTPSYYEAGKYYYFLVEEEREKTWKELTNIGGHIERVDGFAFEVSIPDSLSGPPKKYYFRNQIEVHEENPFEVSRREQEALRNIKKDILAKIREILTPEEIVIVDLSKLENEDE